jgi:adenylate cyclase
MISNNISKINKVIQIFIFFVYLISILGIIISTTTSYIESKIYFYLFYLFFLLLSYGSYKSLRYFPLNKKDSGYLWISTFVTILIYSTGHFLPLLINIEDSSISWRYKAFRSKKGKSVFDTENGYIEKFDPPENTRRDIQIIGIKTETIEKLDGKWPIDWREYAKVINKFKNTNNLLFLDIFFLDEKGEESNILAKSLEDSKNIIVDYSIETSSVARFSIEDYDAKVQILNKFKLTNVIDPNNSGIVWLESPSPPILGVSKNVAGLGFANINKIENLVNRRMPLVAKIYSKNSYNYYPSVDLVILCKYFNIDLVKDTEVFIGKYIKLKNIPKVTILDKAGIETDIMKIPNPQREIVIPIDLSGQMEINFSGSIYCFKDEDLYDVANDWTNESVAIYEKNIFLLAMYYATGVGTAKDTHMSPYGEMSGIEHHAHTLNTVLNQNFVKNPTELEKLFILFFMGFLVTYSLYKYSTNISYLLFFLILISYFTLSIFLFLKYTFLLQIPTVILNVFTIMVSLTGYKIMTEEENVKYIRSTFSKFVSKEIVDELLKNPEKAELGGAKREVTVFFSDIVGFTTLSEQMSPEELVSQLNEYLSVMTDSIIEYKGTIDKYMGDAIMAFWGAPLYLEEHPYYCCVAALAQIKKLDELQSNWDKRGLPKLEIRIGINTGLAILGNMGSTHRMNYTCMGDSVNLGSRLEQINKNYSTKIIISEFTYQRVKDRIYARELDIVKVKGKNMQVKIYELLGLVDDSDFSKYIQIVK